MRPFMAVKTAKGKGSSCPLGLLVLLPGLGEGGRDNLSLRRNILRSGSKTWRLPWGIAKLGTSPNRRENVALRRAGNTP